MCLALFQIIEKSAVYKAEKSCPRGAYILVGETQ